MSKVAKPLQDDEAVEPLDDDGNAIEFVQKDADDNSIKETKKTESGFTPTQRPPKALESDQAGAERIQGEASKANRDLDNREEAEKARQDDHRHDPDGDRARGSIEAKYATGFTQQAGKHTAHTGPLTRGSGRLKIFADAVNAEELDEWAERAPELARLTKELFHGRNATILEGRIIDPLLGKPQRSVKELADQFGVDPKKIYSIVERRLPRLLKEFNRRNAPKAVDGDKCPTCGRVYSEWNFSQCARNPGGPLHNQAIREGLIGVSWHVSWHRAQFGRRPGIHPDCLPERYWSEARAMEKKYLRAGADGK